ncbi:sigma70-ECF: RNA polymerase sigma factor, sigma-70 family [Gaiella occulta]|uniref:Sigma70-ECF: RNA polymerase sigma factor, sigma-70 family n=1 Tax=Gaiella occulta TaxID=1002870 RepID=A0A7M2YT93_9ACTN|nr:RNA polymerase sigma factor [Gaiella occulta]RDI73391.1 sigma70-ECF: RNA polymerase sigma factor, sigma-70 family [Gaiella occulta]
MLSSLSRGRAMPARTVAGLQDDVEAFLVLVREHEVGLRRLAFRLLGDRERAADALQETLLRAFRSRAGFRGEADVRTWLYRIAYNVCLDELRRRRLTVVSLAEATPRAGENDLVEAVVLREDLASALAGLPPVERAAVLLVDAEGLNYAEAAAVLGVPEGTVASRLSRARLTLRRVLADREGVELR